MNLAVSQANHLQASFGVTHQRKLHPIAVLVSLELRNDEANVARPCHVGIGLLLLAYQTASGANYLDGIPR